MQKKVKISKKEKLWKEIKPERGIHILADFYDCSPNKLLFTDSEILQKKCTQLINESGLSEIKQIFYKFPNAGVTGVILLAESHFAIHTWPEKNYLTLDIFVCNFLLNNIKKARNLYNALKLLFRPKNISHREITRD